MNDKKPSKKVETRVRYRKERPIMEALGKSAALAAKLGDTQEKIIERLDTMAQSLTKIQDLDHRREHFYRMVIYYASIGFNDTTIAKQLNCQVSTVRRALASRSIKSEVDRLSTEVIKKQMDQIFTKILPEAVATTYSIMTSEKEKSTVRLEAAKQMMDRALGKPREMIEQKTTIIADVFDELKKAKENAIEVEHSTIDELKDFYEER